MKNLRLMEVILTLEQGGAQQLLLYKLQQFKQLGCIVFVVTFEDGPVRIALENENITVIIIEPKRTNLVNIPYFVAELYRIQQHIQSLIDTYQINILQTHLLNVYDFITANIRRTHPSLKALIWTFHNTHFEIKQYDRLSIKVPAYHFMYHRMAKYCDAIVAVSDDVKISIQHEFGFPEHKLHTIDNAIPVDKFQIDINRALIRDNLGIPTDAPTLLTIGRLTSQKGYHYLLDAFKLILQDYPNCYLCIVGEGEELAELQAVATAHGSQLHIRFLGHREDIVALLATADVFVLPSLWEGLSTALLEAMATRKPIVATAVSGSNQLIVDYVNGRIVSPANSQLLSLAIIDLLRNPSQAQLYGEQAYQTVHSHYDIYRLCDDYIKLYQDLLA